MFKRITALAITAFVAALGVVPTASALSYRTWTEKEHLFGYATLGAMSTYGRGIINMAYQDWDDVQMSDCPPDYVPYPNANVMLVGATLAFEPDRWGGTNMVRNPYGKWQVESEFLGRTSTLVSTSATWTGDDFFTGWKYWGWIVHSRQARVEGYGTIKADYPAVPPNFGPVTYTGRDWGSARITFSDERDERIPLCFKA